MARGSRGSASASEGYSDVAITGVDDPEWGQRVVALVVGDGDSHDDEIRSVAAERIGPWAKPKEIRYVVAIPRTSNGKVQRHALVASSLGVASAVRGHRLLVAGHCLDC